MGARYTMIAPPFYDPIDQDGIYEWYRLLSGSLDLGIVVYDQSWRVGLGTQLGMPLIERLAGLDNVVSLKYGSPNIMEDTVVALERFSDRFAFIDNSLAYTAGLSHMHGATGFISGPSTVVARVRAPVLPLPGGRRISGRRPLARPDSALYGLVPRRVLVRSPLLPTAPPS